jgi:mannan endo-1,4-beta-mannosidase
LGIFGREGVFAAAAMTEAPLAGNYLVAAFDLFRNYDGNGAVVGDLSVNAVTSDGANSSVYAFVHSSASPAGVEIVAINKTAARLPASISIAHVPRLTAAKLYAIQNGSASVAPLGGPPPSVNCDSSGCAMSYTMPPLSATTIVLR